MFAEFDELGLLNFGLDSKEKQKTDTGQLSNQDRPKCIAYEKVPLVMIEGSSKLYGL